MDIIQTVETDASKLWQKLKAFVESDVEPVLEDAEKEAIAIFQPIFAKLEANALTDLSNFVKAVIAGAQGKTATEILALVLDELKVVGGELLSYAETLGENGLLSLVSALLAQLGAAAVAAA